MKVVKIQEDKKPIAHYEDTIDKEVLTSEEAETLYMPIYTFTDGPNKGREAIGLSATFIAVGDTYNLGELLTSKFDIVKDATAWTAGYGVAHVYIDFKEGVDNNTIKKESSAIAEEITRFYNEHGFELKPTVKDYNYWYKDTEKAGIQVYQYFKILSVKKSTILDKEHNLKNYEFDSKAESGGGYYSAREIKNMAKRLSAKLGIPVEDIEMYMNDDNLPAYKINK